MVSRVANCSGEFGLVYRLLFSSDPGLLNGDDVCIPCYFRYSLLDIGALVAINLYNFYPSSLVLFLFSFSLLLLALSPPKFAFFPLYVHRGTLIPLYALILAGQSGVVSAPCLPWQLAHFRVASLCSHLPLILTPTHPLVLHR